MVALSGRKINLGESNDLMVVSLVFFKKRARNRTQNKQGKFAAIASAEIKDSSLIREIVFSSSSSLKLLQVNWTDNSGHNQCSSLFFLIGALPPSIYLLGSSSTTRQNPNEIAEFIRNHLPTGISSIRQDLPVSLLVIYFLLMI